MSEAQALFTVLQQSADPACVAALERLVREAPDRKLSRVNVLDFARREGLDEEGQRLEDLGQGGALGDHAATA